MSCWKEGQGGRIRANRQLDLRGVGEGGGQAEDEVVGERAHLGDQHGGKEAAARASCYLQTPTGLVSWFLDFRI